jgi:hypothetical protein
MSEPPTDTTVQRVLVAKLGRHWKLWERLSRWFPIPSLVTIIVILATGWGWYVTDKAKTAATLQGINDRLLHLEDGQHDMSERLGHVEEGFFYAKGVVESSPTPRLRGKH